MRFFRFGIIAVAVASILLSGCGLIAKKAVEQTTGVSVDQKGNSVTVKGKDGDQLTFNNQVPDDLKSFPVPSGFKVDTGSSMSAGGQKTSVASWKGKSTVKEVLAFYTKTLPDQGWKEDMSGDSGDSAFYTGSKDKLSLTLAITDKAGTVEISVILATTSK